MGAAPQPRLLNRFPHRRLGVKVFEHSRFVSKHKKAVDFDRVPKVGVGAVS